MTNLTIYAAAYNVEAMRFNWRATLDNWARFQAGTGQICIAVNTSTDDSFNLIRSYAESLNAKYGAGLEWTIIQCDIPYTDRAFDGKVKTVALRSATRDMCMLLDLDEVIPLSTRAAWEYTVNTFAQYRAQALLIPSIDLFHSPKHYKSLGQKWYLHVNSPHIERGPVDFARKPDGTIDITKSDTTEPVHVNGGSLISTAHVLANPSASETSRLAVLFQGFTPYVYHLGWLDKEQRVRQSAFWTPVWNNRAGAELERVKTLAELDAIPYWEHKLPHWETE